MTQTTLLISPRNIPIIKYDNYKIQISDLLLWKNKLLLMNVDLNNIVVFAEIDLFASFVRCVLDTGISSMLYSESIIPLSERIEFCGLNVYEEDEVVMKVYVYYFLPNTINK